VIMQPIVRIQRLSDKDMLGMQKGIANFVENRPKRAKELGIDDIALNEEQVNSSLGTKAGRNRSSAKYKDNSEGEEAEGDAELDKTDAKKKKTTKKQSNISRCHYLKSEMLLH